MAVSPKNGGAPSYRYASDDLKKDPDVIAATKKGNLDDGNGESDSDGENSENCDDGENDDNDKTNMMQYCSIDFPPPP